MPRSFAFAARGKKRVVLCVGSNTWETCPLPSVILDPCSGIQFFSGKHQSGFPPAGENDGRGGRGPIPAASFPSVILGPCPGIQAAIVGAVRVFLPSVILGALPGNPGPPFPPIRQAGSPPRTPTWIPTFGENDGRGGRRACRAFPPLRHSRGLPGNPGPPSPASFFRRHSRALLGNPVPPFFLSPPSFSSLARESSPQPMPSKLEKMSTFNNGWLPHESHVY